MLETLLGAFCRQYVKFIHHFPTLRGKIKKKLNFFSSIDVVNYVIDRVTLMDVFPPLLIQLSAFGW